MANFVEYSGCVWWIHSALVDGRWIGFCFFFLFSLIQWGPFFCSHCTNNLTDWQWIFCSRLKQQATYNAEQEKNCSALRFFFFARGNMNETLTRWVFTEQKLLIVIGIKIHQLDGCTKLRDNWLAGYTNWWVCVWQMELKFLVGSATRRQCLQSISSANETMVCVCTSVYNVCLSDCVHVSMSYEPSNNAWARRRAMSLLCDSDRDVDSLNVKYVFSDVSHLCILFNYTKKVFRSLLHEYSMFLYLTLKKSLHTETTVPTPPRPIQWGHLTVRPIFGISNKSFIILHSDICCHSCWHNRKATSRTSTNFIAHNLRCYHFTCYFFIFT